MKKSTFYIVAFVLLTIPLVSQDKDEDEGNSSHSYSYWNRTKVGGAGGVTPIVGMFDNKVMDKFLSSSGLPTLGSDPMYLFGGEGYGYIMFLRNVRMGGFGVSGKRTVSVIEPVLRKEAEINVSYGGFLIDYVQPIAYRLDVALGASIGGGSMNIVMYRDDRGFKIWDSLWTDFGNSSSKTSSYSRNLKGSFVVFNPHVNIEYTLLTWIQLRVGVGYPITFSPHWTLDDKYDVDNVPSSIKMSGYTVNAGIMFGYFGW